MTNCIPVAVTSPRLPSIVTVPVAPPKTAKPPSAQGALISPPISVQLSLPATLCQLPSPPSTTPSFFGPAAPSQKVSVSPAVLTRFTWPASEVCTKKSGDGMAPIARPLSVSAPP